MSGADPQILPIREWMDMIERGEVRIPEFQRDFVWDRKKAITMIEAILKDRPVGSLLVLKVDATKRKTPFQPRSIDGAPEAEAGKCKILVLDGQQRLTALWHALRDTDSDYAYFLRYPGDGAPVGHAERKPADGKKKWINDNKKCVDRGMIPIHLFSSATNNVKKWIDDAYKDEEGMLHAEQMRRLENWVENMSAWILDFKIPYLPLPVEISETEAIQAFIESNTSSQKLKKFEITVATMRRDLMDNLRELRDETWDKVPTIRDYMDEDGLGDLLLKIACLRNDLSPTEGNYARPDVLKDVQRHIGAIRQGIQWTCSLLKSHSVLSKKFLPSVVPFRVLPALHGALPSNDRGRDTCRKLAKKYVWRAFLTDRYTSNAAGLLLSDCKGLRDRFEGKNSRVEILDEQLHRLPECSDLMKASGWPTGSSTFSRAILTLSLMKGAQDLDNTDKIDGENIDKAHAHHIFPKQYLKDHGLTEKVINNPLNCMLIRRKTNQKAGKKPPIEYLTELYERDIREEIREEDILKRLKSHLIPGKLLLQEDVGNVKKHYEEFLRQRAEMMMPFINALAEGKDPD